MDLAATMLASTWKEVLQDEFKKPYFTDIENEVTHRIKSGKVVYPPISEVFNAFNLTSYEQVRVVILGQDPYHRVEQAMGLCFSVKKGAKIPRSLQRIFKEIENDVGIPIPSHGDLTNWAKQGVFMLNAILTVEEGIPASHSKIGWTTFTDQVIQILSDRKEGLCFLLWGGYARSKKKMIDQTKHHIFESAHPSPLAGNAFFGNNHFSRVNKIIEDRGEMPINWSVD